MTMPSDQDIIDLVSKAFDDAQLRYSEFGGGLQDNLDYQKHLLPFWPKFFKREDIAQCPKCGVLFELHMGREECPYCFDLEGEDHDNA